ncbi:odorant receptor 67c-like [Euwallacea similis]|uniref:odorant receptor 67c-like n=1 Tax=Euwallacea similis TaxID=1736056 RepID=UPI003450DE42
MSEQVAFDFKNQQLIKWARLFMIAAGAWDLPISKNPILQALFKIYCIFMKFAYALFFLMLLGETIRLIMYHYELPIIIANIGVFFNATKIAVKMIIYVKYNITDLFREIIVKEKLIWESENEEIITMYRKKIVVCSVYGISIAAGTLSTIAFLELYGAYLIVQMAKMNVGNETIESHIMYQTLIPLNKLDHVKTLFLTQIVWSWSGGTCNTMTHGVYITLLVYASTQLQMLQIRFKHCVEEDFDGSNMQEKIDFLKDLIKEHQHIINFIKFLNESTKYILMIEYILSSMDIASVSANLIKMEASELMWLTCFLVLLVLQISLLAWICNEIKVQSEEIGNALYQSRWYLLNKEALMLTQFVITRAKIPLVLTIGPFAAMTNGSALTVFKAAYSYVSIMTK